MPVESDFILAHNAGFDRPMIEAVPQVREVSASKIWTCSLKQVDWASLGFLSAKQELLSVFHGFHYSGHRALTDIDALANALETGHLNGAAIDVFPVEPKSNTEEFQSPLRKFDNVILTPHVGGSTQEAQENIGIEVAGKLAKYSDNGSTLSAVNFPEVSLPEHTGRSRLLHVHKNQPGILTQINQAFAEKGINIEAQYLQTNAEIGYVVVDVKEDRGYEALAELQQIEGTIKTRILH